MKVFYVFLLLLIAGSGYSQPLQQPNVNWSLVLEQKDLPPLTLCSFNEASKFPLGINRKLRGLEIAASVSKKGYLLVFSASAKARRPDSCYFSLKATYAEGSLYSYLGEAKEEALFRQSPHDPAVHSFGDLPKQDIPMLAVKDHGGFTVAINDSPCFYDNYNTQWLNPEGKEAALFSGDPGKVFGKQPKYVRIREYYHNINRKTQLFNGIIFRSAAADLSNLRKDALFAIARHWGNGITDRFGATSFASNYMLLRKNETGNSRYWVVPGILYSNKQYSRDAFWQSMVLPPQFDSECYRNEAVAQSRGAERQLFALIWAYRSKQNKGKPDLAAGRKSLEYIEQHTRGGLFFSNDNPEKKDFQSWFDAVAFDNDDVITYNQGLLAVALLAAEKLGLKPRVSAGDAIRQYQALFNEAGGYFPASRKKDLPAVDALVGDVLAQVFFKRSLLSTESVSRHFNTILKYAKTPYGYKVVCLPDGGFPPPAVFHASNYPVDPSLGRGPGNYQYSGSWFLYDMLFLTDAWLHKVPGALEELKWRATLDFRLGGTYFEYINTATGQPEKANQGWNAAVYAIWKKLMDRGEADSSLLKAIDELR